MIDTKQEPLGILKELLCIIHRDGGHYISQHGLDKAIKDAEEVLYQWRETYDKWGEAYSECGNCPTAYAKERR